jgi:hypothetical protein
VLINNDKKESISYEKIKSGENTGEKKALKIFKGEFSSGQETFTALRHGQALGNVTEPWGWTHDTLTSDAGHCAYYSIVEKRVERMLCSFNFNRI